MQGNRHSPVSSRTICETVVPADRSIPMSRVWCAFLEDTFCSARAAVRSWIPGRFGRVVLGFHRIESPSSRGARVEFAGLRAAKENFSRVNAPFEFQSRMIYRI